MPLQGLRRSIEEGGRQMGGKSWERLGAASGVVFFVLVLASFFTPDTPDADDPTAEIVASIADDRTAHLFSVYLGFLATLFFLVFTAALWSRLRAAEPERGPSVLVLLGGLGSSLMILVANGVFLALIEAADEGREPEAVRALFQLDEIMFVGIGITTAAFYAGAALSALANNSLPRWLGGVAAAFAAVFPVTMLAIFSRSDEGGVLGGIFFIALLLNFLWILATSIVMLRERPAPTRG
jgi:hypothetical protein